MAQTLPDGAKGLLDAPNFAHVVTLMDDGMPQVTPVWIDREDDTVVFNTAKGRAKHRNLERDNRVALSVHDQDNPYHYVQVRGRVSEITTDGADAHIDAMAKKYLDADEYPFRKPEEERVIVRIDPEAVQYYPPRS